MIRTTLNATECFLITEEPNWGTGKVAGEFNLLTSGDASSTRREERNRMSSTARSTLKWTADLSRSDAIALQLSLKGLNLASDGSPAPLQPILCPFWPGAAPYGVSSKYSAEWSIIWEPEFSVYLIFLTSDGIGGYSATDASQVAPLLWGIFDKLPLPKAITDEESQCDFLFIENGPADAALTCSATPTNGPAINGVNPPIFAEVPQYTVESGGVDITIDRKQIGYTRDEAQTVFPQIPARTLKSGFMLTGDTAAKLLALWLETTGSYSPFWMPAGVSPVRLTADVGSADTVLHVDAAASLGGHKHVFLQSDTWAAQHVASIGDTSINLDSAVGAFNSASTVVQPLLLVRLVSDKLTIEWTEPDTASATIEAIELPAEYAVPEGETFGTTIGPLGMVAFLYLVTDGTSFWYATSYESSIFYEGQTYTPQHIDHGSITERLNLEDSNVDIDCRVWNGCPFSRFRIARLGAAMTVSIIKVTSVTPAPGSGETIFTGKVQSVNFDQSQASLKVTVGGRVNIFDGMLPRPLCQRNCRAMLFDSKCKLDRAQWTFACTMPTPPAPGAPFEYVVDGLSWPQGALPTIGADYFAMGFLIRTLTDGTQAAATIVSSAPISGGNVTLTLESDLVPFPTGSETWAITPGCAGRWVEDCQEKFSNPLNFRGDENMPAASPATAPITPPVRASKK